MLLIYNKKPKLTTKISKIKIKINKTKFIPKHALDLTKNKNNT